MKFSLAAIALLLTATEAAHLRSKTRAGLKAKLSVKAKAKWTADEWCSEAEIVHSEWTFLNEFAAFDVDGSGHLDEAEFDEWAWDTRGED